MSNNNELNKLDKLLTQLQNDILDEYNQKNISKKEMKNIMDWTRKVVEARKKNPDSDILFIEMELEDLEDLE
jgi:hypothetical protein